MGSYADSPKTAEVLTLYDSGTDLPTFLSYIQHPETEGTTLSLARGSIAIQSFDTDGEISGVVQGDLVGINSIGAKVRREFWVDLGENAD